MMARESDKRGAEAAPIRARTDMAPLALFAANVASTRTAARKCR